MDSHARYVVQLSQAASFGEERVGGKAANLSRLQQAGYVIPEGFCVTVSAYEHFLRMNQLTEVIASEIGRKSMESMRWEELWDVALRIRSVFSKGKLPEGLVDEIGAAVKRLGVRQNLVVRSSAPGEDGAGRSFAGLHESYVGVRGVEEVCERVRQVWASLWSDAALLYRRELKLDPLRSRMAVVIQRLIRRNRSGVAFGRDPRDPSRNRALIEAVPGLCSNLVDGVIDPQRWSLDRSSSEVISSPEESVSPLLEVSDLHRILQILLSLEELFGSATDLEWTGRRERLTLLQARPITGILSDSNDERKWYLTLSPGSHRLKELCEEVVNRLIPELQKEGERLVVEPLEQLETSGLLSRIEERAEVLSTWERIYREKFIPFAHGVRQFGRYYNDVMKPHNPYEFVELLETERMLAWSRNEALEKLSKKLRKNRPLREVLLRILSLSGGKESEVQSNLDSLRKISGGGDFLKEFEAFTAEHGELAYQKTYLKQRSDLFLKNILALAQSPQGFSEREEERRLRAKRAAELERDFLQTVGREAGQEALDLLRIARLSWRLRDDDNILMGRLEGQLLRAVELGQARLREADKGEVTQRLAELLETLKNRVSILRSPGPTDENPESAPGETPRQLVGQPAAPGLGKGMARCIQTLDDLGEFAAGEILVCDAIQPTMTHLVPLAAGVVERRGGMLIHGAIIARELGIPCVNGIRDAVKILQSGELLTVDGYLGIVTVGEATLDLEKVD